MDEAVDKPDPGVRSPHRSDRSDEVDLVVVTIQLDAADPDRLGALLAAYVVASRSHPGCRNIDLCASATRAGRFLVIEKWESHEAQRDHFDSADMLRLAEACRSGGVLAAPPEIDLHDPISAHDLR